MAFLLVGPTVFGQSREVNPEWEKNIKRRLEHMLEEKLHSHAFEQHAGGTFEKGTTQIGTEVEVSGHSRMESEIHAAINPTDTANIVIAPIQEVTSGGSMGGGQLSLPLYITTDFGQTWTTSSFSGGGGGGGDPVLAFAADGTLYFSWLHLTQSGMSMTINMLFASSTDGGFTWSAVDTIDSGTMSMMGGGRMVDKQWMAVDKSNSTRKGTLYTIYVLMEMQGMSQNMAVAIKRKLPGHAAFENTVVELTDASFSEVQFPSVSVDATGMVHAFWWGIKNGSSGLWHRSSSDGSTFGSTHFIAGVRFPQQGSNVSVPDHLPQRLGVMPQFEVDNHPGSPHTGAMYAVWNANDPGTGAGSYNEPFHVYFSVSTNGGSSWSTAKRIDDLSVSNTHQFHPSISVSPSGTVIATWYDGRDDTLNTKVHYYTAFSTDRGATWTGNVRVSTRSSDMSESVQGRFGIGDYDKALSTGHYAIPIWSDGRSNSGDMNVYAAFVPIGQVVPVELSSFTASVHDRIVTLRWRTESEVNNAGFEVQPSRDGEEFTTSAFVPGSGTTLLPREYVHQEPIDEPRYYRLKQVDHDGSFAYSPVVQAVPAAPDGIELAQSFPNPTADATTIPFSIAQQSEVSVTIYDLLGTPVKTIVSGTMPGGTHSVTWDGRDARGERVVPGVYMYTLKTPDALITRTVTIQ